MINYKIPGTTMLTSAPIYVETDGGPWANHNMPCAVCREGFAVLELNGWQFQPCRGCQEIGWKLVKRPSLLRRLDALLSGETL